MLVTWEFICFSGKIPVTGNIIIEESVDIINKKSFTIPDPPQCVELPQNLRTRHPLLGVGELL